MFADGLLGAQGIINFNWQLGIPPILDPLKVHHTEYRIRSINAGYGRIPTMTISEWTDASGSTCGRSRIAEQRVKRSVYIYSRRRFLRSSSRSVTVPSTILLLSNSDSGNG